MIHNVHPDAFNQPRQWREVEAKLRPFVAKRVAAADVDDVVQDIFIRLHRGLPGLRDDQRFGPWLVQVARSAIIDYWRASARRPTTTPIGEEASPPNDALINDVEQEVAMYAGLFVSMLPSPYKEALTLTELEGRTQKEAAELLGISLSGMKSRVQRGRQKLRAALEECCHIALDARNRVVACEPRVDGKLPDGCCD